MHRFACSRYKTQALGKSPENPDLKQLKHLSTPPTRQNGGGSLADSMCVKVMASIMKTPDAYTIGEQEASATGTT